MAVQMGCKENEKELLAEWCKSFQHLMGELRNDATKVFVQANCLTNREALLCLLQQLIIRHDALLSEFRIIELHEDEFPDDILWIREAFHTFYLALERIMQTIENERKSKEMVEALPNVIISALHVDDGLFCVVCRDDFIMGEEVSEIPCKIRHVFHSGCIQPWLENHNTCPLCTTQFSMENN